VQIRLFVLLGLEEGLSDTFWNGVVRGVLQVDARLPGVGYEALHPELEGIDPEDYPATHRMRIPADVAPYSREYQKASSIVRHQAKDNPDLLTEYERIYALQQSVGLQPGSIKAVIQHLADAGLLERSEVAQRGRRRRTFSPTESGEIFLREEWKSSLDRNREMESVLRGATLALLMDDIGEAIKFLHESASGRIRRQGPQELGMVSLEGKPIDLHAAMRAVYENRRWAMEADLLREFAENLVEVAKERERK